jgi:hypothetical protein
MVALKHKLSPYAASLEIHAGCICIDTIGYKPSFLTGRCLAFSTNGALFVVKLDKQLVHQNNITHEH